MELVQAFIDSRHLGTLFNYVQWTNLPHLFMRWILFHVKTVKHPCLTLKRDDIVCLILQYAPGILRRRLHAMIILWIDYTVHICTVLILVSSMLNKVRTRLRNFLMHTITENDVVLNNYAQHSGTVPRIANDVRRQADDERAPVMQNMRQNDDKAWARIDDVQTLKGTIKYRLISSIKYRLLSSIKYQLVQIVCVPGKYSSTQRRLFNEISQIPHKATLVVHLGTYDMPAQDIYHCLSQFHRYITTTTSWNITTSNMLWTRCVAT